jgi:uncharacterized protein (TIGR03083 family)
VNDAPNLVRFYRESHSRVVELVGELDAGALATPVPACPGWSVSDVVAHVAAVAEDVPAGRLTRPPSDEETAAQVARFAGHPIGDVLQVWEQHAAAMEEVIGAHSVRPAVLDVLSHEHDIRGALGRAGARDDEAVRAGAEMLLSFLSPPVPLRVRCDAFDVQVGPDEGQPLELQTSHFEAFRWRLGRRSRAQLAGMDWTGDPSPVLDTLVIFGPARRDVIE